MGPHRLLQVLGLGQVEGWVQVRLQQLGRKVASAYRIVPKNLLRVR